MRDRSTRHGFEVDDQGRTLDIRPARKHWLRETDDWAFDDDYRWPRMDSTERNISQDFQYLNSDIPRGEGKMSPWHVGRSAQCPNKWCGPMEFLHAYGGEYGVLSMDDSVDYRRVEEDEYWGQAKRAVSDKVNLLIKRSEISGR